MATGTVFTSAGKAIVTNLVSGIGGTVAKWIQWGIGTTTPVVGDTAIQTATTGNETRVSGTVTRTTTSVTNDTVQVVGTLTAAAGTNGQSITEFGMFDASGTSGGNMIIHCVYGAIVVATGDSIQFTCTLQFT